MRPRDAQGFTLSRTWSLLQKVHPQDVSLKPWPDEPLYVICRTGITLPDAGGFHGCRKARLGFLKNPAYPSFGREFAHHVNLSQPLPFVFRLSG